MTVNTMRLLKDINLDFVLTIIHWQFAKFSSFMIE